MSAILDRFPFLVYCGITILEKEESNVSNHGLAGLHVLFITLVILLAGFACCSIAWVGSDSVVTGVLGTTVSALAFGTLLTLWLRHGCRELQSDHWRAEDYL